MQAALGYIFISSGARPRGDITNHPGARQQIANLRTMTAWDTNPRFSFDYSRKIRELPSSLPRLHKALLAAQERGTLIIMDDFCRLFSHAEDRAALWCQLLPFGEHLVQLRAKQKLSSVSEIQRIAILSARPPIKCVIGSTREERPLVERQEQTRRATRVSAVARKRQADGKAKELAEVRTELQETQDKVTLQEIANTANERGLQTTRGKTWSAATVQRALKRLDDNEVSDQANQL